MALVSVERTHLLAMADALSWFIENDETNRGDEPLPNHNGLTWDEINCFWVAGLNNGQTVLDACREYLAANPE